MTGDPAARAARLAAAIRLDLARLERVSDEAAQALADFSDAAPSLRELRGTGDIVHDLYTGLERVFERVAVEFDGGVPAGPGWHRQLLESMTLEIASVRPAVLESETATALEEFLRFRHLFRNLYGFDLDWSRLRPLVERTAPTFAKARDDLERFLAFLDAIAKA